MSKKINENNISAITATAEPKKIDWEELTRDYPAVTAKDLQEKFEQYPNVSLRKLAPAVGVNYGVLLKKSKEPVKGEVYDPEATNWEAIAEVCSATLERRRNYANIDWEELNSKGARKGATLIKDMEKFKVGDKVYLRRNNETPYEIVYKTETHVVLLLEGTQEPIAWSNSTFLINGPVFEPRATKVTAKAEEVEED